uniref:ADP-ribosyl cyclase/cyclic ADP-ribose hydrolase 1 n=1 Tax=Leptobrachium leishanense TaxID=445787 RepID=A0A8C5LNU6_9ANUR
MQEWVGSLKHKPGFHHKAYKGTFSAAATDQKKSPTMPLESGMSALGKRKMLLAAGILTIIIVTIVSACVIALYVTSQERDHPLIWKGKGTTRHVKDIILGRCYDYLLNNPHLGRDLDCNGIWQELTTAIYWKDPCKVTGEDYQRLVEVTHETLPCNTSLLWSRTNNLAHRYTKANDGFRTLEDTFLGYLFNGLTWCGKTHSAGMDYKSCPAWDECENHTMSSFWKLASATHLVLPSRKPIPEVIPRRRGKNITTKNILIFKSVEIPSMNPDLVSEVRLWLAHGIDGTQRSKCSSDSLMELKGYIEKHGLGFSCVDNQRSVQLLQCIENPGAAACMRCN